MKDDKKTRALETRNWFTRNVPNPVELDSKVEATLEYVKRIQEPEDGEYMVWAFEVVSGEHGVYTPRMFLDVVLSNGKNVFMSEEFGHVDYLDRIMELFDEVSKDVAYIFKRSSKLPGDFYVGHNEADGSLGVFYTVKV